MNKAQTTHPDEATPVCPSLRLRRLEEAKKVFVSPALFAALAGERAVQRSVDRVSRSQRANEYAMGRRNNEAMAIFNYNIFS
ncbi:hypothetical protein FHS10_005182 [Mucilaginibacter dorajii]|uniref:Uncharacterized protein n=1 Tax=Mucilaginibacter dorajii TaxID=692994 RepID=A0ABP7PX70_9SPHI|nr:hypothetical protein [Mucilaginibacter dorajii]